MTIKTAGFRRQFSYHTILSLLLSLTVGVAAFFISERPGWLIYDSFMKGTALEDNNAVAMITLGQSSLNQLEKEGLVFPLPRQIYGAIAKVAEMAGAKAVVFDILFTEESRFGPEDDQLFAQFIEEVSIPVFMPGSSMDGTVKAPVQVLREQVTLGGVHSKNESDGIFRQIPDYLPGPEQMPIASMGHSVYDTLIEPSSQKNNQAPFLHYYEPRAIPHIPLYNLLVAFRMQQEGKPLPQEVQNIKDRVWVVGYTAPGLHDLKPTPLDASTPGMVVLATSIANRLDEQGIHALHWAWQLGCLILLSVLCLLIANKSEGPLPGTIMVVLLGLVAPYVASYVAWRAAHWMNALPVILGVLSGAGAQLQYNFHNFWKDRLKMAKSLKNSMSPDMVELIRKGDIEVSRFGEERIITVLFSDLAGFTTLSEKLTPEELVTILNAYLDNVVALITDNKGYVDKFIGDAVMALWGAPVIQEDHAQHAIEAAANFQQVCDEFDQRMRARDPHFPNLYTRVGVHSGPAIVGNIGAYFRHNYTAIGDTVNLAARLEGMGKNYNVGLTISADTIELANAHDTPGLMELDQVIVKGKSKPTRIYTIVSPDQSEQIGSYSSGLNAYYNGDWQTALEFFRRAREIPASLVMISRCEQALRDGKLERWREGAWVYDTK